MLVCFFSNETLAQFLRLLQQCFYIQLLHQYFCYKRGNKQTK